MNHSGAQIGEVTPIRRGDDTLTHLAHHLRRRTPPKSSRHDLVAEVELLSGAQSALDAYRHRVVTAIDSLGDHGVDAAEVLRSVGRVSNRAARRVSKTAARMSELPRTAEVLAAGTITAEHADVIADAARQVDAVLVDSELLDMAAVVSADLFARQARGRVSARESEANIETRQQRQHRLRSVKKSTDDNGMGVWFAKLDPESSAAVSASLDAEYERLWRDDGGRDLAGGAAAGAEVPGGNRRSPEQRMADAFVALITRPAGSAASGLPHVRQQMLSIVDLSRMRGSNPEGAANLADGAPLPQNMLERLACISEITGIIFDGPRMPIWVGRGARSSNAAQWKALVSRDRGCVGCGAGHGRCEAHHIKVWNRGGPTDITNLVLVCSRCHHNIHDRNMKLDRHHGGGWSITPRDGPPARRSAA